MNWKLVLSRFKWAIALVAATLAVWVLLLPELKRSALLDRGALEGTVQEILGHRSRIVEIDAQIAGAGSLHDEYERLVADGFAAPQDRLAVAEIIEAAAAEHGLVQADYVFSPAQSFSDPEGRFGGVGVEVTRITIEVGAMLDHDLLDFATALLDGMPGHARLAAVRLEKVGRIDRTALLEIPPESIPIFIEGQFVVDWRTALPPAPADEAGR